MAIPRRNQPPSARFFRRFGRSPSRHERNDRQIPAIISANAEQEILSAIAFGEKWMLRVDLTRQWLQRHIAATAALLAAHALFAQSTPASGARDATEIRAARRAQNAAMAAGDVERAATWWTDDVAIRRGLGAPISGVTAYKEILERAPVSDTVLVYDRTTTGVTVSEHWPLAFETGTWIARRGGKGEALISGQYSAQWVKREGKWLIRGEVFVALKCSGVGCASKSLP